MESIKTSFYDFFGYFIPGLMLIIVAAAECLIARVFTIAQAWAVIEQANALIIAVAVVIVYFLGHILGACGSFVFEKVFKNKRNDIGNIMDDFSREKIGGIFKNKYKQNFSSSNARFLVCSAEENTPKTYATALVFMSIYGMARNSAFVFAAAALFRIVWMAVHLSAPYWYVGLVYIGLAVILYYQYSRFYKYFTRHIINCFILFHYKDDTAAQGG